MMYDDEGFEASWAYEPFQSDELAPVATESDAHAEWHRNAGVPMGQPGCPQDACDGDPYDDQPWGEQQGQVNWLESRYDYDEPPF